MTIDQLEETGPIDYVVLEWRNDAPATGEIQGLLLDLVDRGIVRVLDIAFVTKQEDGTVAGVDFGDVTTLAEVFAEFEGASSGLLDFTDLEDAALALEPGTTGVVLIWENLWAAPIATAMRRSGGQLVASGRIPVQAILASLDALESER